jgi:hypothetical protein
MGLKNGMRAVLRNAPADVVRSMRLPALRRAETLRGKFDYVHLFDAARQVRLRAFVREIPGPVEPAISTGRRAPRSRWKTLGILAKG